MCCLPVLTPVHQNGYIVPILGLFAYTQGREGCSHLTKEPSWSANAMVKLCRPLCCPCQLSSFFLLSKLCCYIIQVALLSQSTQTSYSSHRLAESRLLPNIIAYSVDLRRAMPDASVQAPGEWAFVIFTLAVGVLTLLPPARGGPSLNTHPLWNKVIARHVIIRP